MNNTIKEYKTVGGLSSGDLDSLVNELLKQGYIPYGNPYAESRTLFQAMIKEVEKAEPRIRSL